MSGLIWIQTVWHFDDIPEEVFEKVDFEKKSIDGKKCPENLPAYNLTLCLGLLVNFSSFFVVW